MEPTRTLSEALVKLLAIIGFFALLGLVLWVIVQGVRLFPSAFTSLAPMAELVSNYRPERELALEIEKSIVNSGDVFTLKWNDAGTGTYEFSYRCVEGVLLRVRSSEGMLRDVPCKNGLSLDREANGLFIRLDAKEQRFSDVTLMVTHTAESGAITKAEQTVTIVNATIPNRDEIVATGDIDTEIPSITLPQDVVSPNASPSIVAILPKSYENGFTDLRMAYQGVGTLVNGSFVPKASFNGDDTAAFRFEVKNIGTKTGGTWTYELTLPGDVRYTSEPQAALAPNERVVFTVGFELGEKNTPSVKISGELTASGDTNTANNDFDWSVRVSE
jgi:hypothetical protein